MTARLDKFFQGASDYGLDLEVAYALKSLVAIARDLEDLGRSKPAIDGAVLLEIKEILDIFSEEEP